jgi:hypothetical protein
MDIIQKYKIKYSNLFKWQTINPKRNWKILLIIFIILILISLGFDGYMYRMIVNGDMYVSINKKEIVIGKLKSDDLKNILDSFVSKKAQITNLKVQNLIDPSL